MYEEWWITCMGLLMLSAMLRACLYYRRAQAVRYTTVYIHEDPTVPIAQQGYPAAGQVVYYGTPQTLTSPPAPAGPYPYAQPGSYYDTSAGPVVVGVPAGQ